jgi:branched-chain amino acid transport system ATP-binding protein
VAVGSQPPLLETRGLSKRYGGVDAVSAVDFRLEREEVRGLIGPNGAGKTTLVSLIAGRIPASAGRVLFEGRDVTTVAAWDRVRLGMAYAFQVTSVYRGLSVRDNLALAAQRRHLRRARDWAALDEAAVAEDVETLLARVGLAERGDQPTAALSYGHQRVLEVAMALALRPRLLILDEPTQGLAEAEIDAFCRLVRDLAGSATLLLIEHNLAVVLELATRVTVMDQGRILAEGAPREIEAHPQVQQAYLGPWARSRAGVGP